MLARGKSKDYKKPLGKLSPKSQKYNRSKNIIGSQFCFFRASDNNSLDGKREMERSGVRIEERSKSCLVK